MAKWAIGDVASVKWEWGVRRAEGGVGSVEGECGGGSVGNCDEMTIRRQLQCDNCCRLQRFNLKPLTVLPGATLQQQQQQRQLN